MTPSQAMNLLSLNPARLLEMDATIGSIEVGKEADLVAFRNKHSYADVVNVWVRGVNTFQAHVQAMTSDVSVDSEMM